MSINYTTAEWIAIIRGLSLLVAFAIGFYVIDSYVKGHMLEKAGGKVWMGYIPFFRTWKIYEISWGRGGGWIYLLILPATIILRMATVHNLLEQLLLTILAVFVVTTEVFTRVKQATAFGKRSVLYVAALMLIPILPEAVFAYSKNVDYKCVPEDGWTFNDIKGKIKNFFQKGGSA